MIRFLLTSLILFPVSFTSGQDSESGKIQIGISAGYANTTVTGSIVDHYEKRPAGALERRGGYTASLSFRYHFTGLLYSEVGFGYYQKGGYFFESGYVDDIVMPVNYLNIPVVFGVRSTNEGPVHFTAEAGTSFDIRLSCNEPGCLNLDDTFQCCGPSPTTKDQIGVTFGIRNPISLIYGFGVEVKVSEDVQATGRFRYFDDINYFFGDRKEFSISGTGLSVELGAKYRIK